MDVSLTLALMHLQIAQNTSLSSLCTPAKSPKKMPCIDQQSDGKPDVPYLSVVAKRIHLTSKIYTSASTSLLILLTTSPSLEPFLCSPTTAPNEHSQHGSNHLLLSDETSYVLVRFLSPKSITSKTPPRSHFPLVAVHCRAGD